ncbi:zinc finger CCHC domain-containing protein 8 [Nephila pilipes]|uniref:Zinc finger CCHC domain-containing protein 8 n=1 Tax=Nephila pilipes TaxID=299642 RepID=A0A8X6USR8_NEPPI|nr:zinc finger CCHC domain-containing protein 8 [Nephila pilipes]
MADVSSDVVHKSKNNHGRGRGKHKGHKQGSHFKENDIENETKYNSKTSNKNVSPHKDSKYKSHDRSDRNEERKKFSNPPSDRCVSFRTDEKNKHTSSHHFNKHEVNDDNYRNSFFNDNRPTGDSFNRNAQIHSSFNEIRCDDRKTSDERFVSYNRNAVSNEDEFVASLWQKIDYLSNQVEGLSQENERLKCNLNGRRSNLYNSHEEVNITFLNKDLEERFVPVLVDLANSLIRGYISVEELREFLHSKNSAKDLESLKDVPVESLFALDNSTTEPKDNPRVPMYETNFSEILENANTKNKSEENIKNKPSSNVSCFNCSEEHSINHCPYKIDYYRVAEAKRKRRVPPHSKLRYHIQEEIKGDFKPGVLSEELRNALDLKPYQIPLFVYRMRLLSYPPGWLEEAQVESSGINVYDSKGYALRDESDEGFNMNGSNVQYDPDKFIDFPGFNVPLSPDFEDESYELGLPPMQEHHLRSVAEQNIPKLDKCPSRKRKMKLSNDNSSKIQRIEEDMDLDEDLGETYIEFVPPLPKDAPPPLPPDDIPPPPKDDERTVTFHDSDSGTNTPMSDSLMEALAPVGERYKIKQTAKEEEEDDDPSLKELEEMKKRLVMELGIVSGNSSPAVQDESQTNASDAEDSNPVSESRDAFRDSSNDVSSFSDCSFNSSPAEIRESSNGLKRSDSKCSKSKHMTLGAPSLSRHSSFNKLPNYDKFSKNVASHMNFENLPNSTGTYEKMRKVIKKVKEKIHSFMP